MRLYSNLEDEVLPNNTILSPGDIGTGPSQAVLCETARDGTDHGGTWYNPTGEEVPDGASGNVLFTFTSFGTQPLSRGSVEFDSAGVEGVYRCRIRDENGIFQTLYAGIYRTSSYQISSEPLNTAPCCPSTALFILASFPLSPSPLPHLLLLFHSRWSSGARVHQLHSSDRSLLFASLLLFQLHHPVLPSNGGELVPGWAAPPPQWGDLPVQPTTP